MLEEEGTVTSQIAKDWFASGVNSFVSGEKCIKKHKQKNKKSKIKQYIHVRVLCGWCEYHLYHFLIAFIDLLAQKQGFYLLCQQQDCSDLNPALNNFMGSVENVKQMA